MLDVNTEARSRSFDARRVGAAALYGLGGAALYGAKASALVVTSGTVLTLNPGEGGAAFDWDIDGDSVVDFRFEDTRAGHEFCMAVIGYAGAGLASDDGSKLMPVDLTTTVGDSLDYLTWGCGRVYDVHCDHTSLDLFTRYDEGADFTGTFGFKFDSGGTTLYGAADFRFSSWDGSDPTDGIFSIEGWSYEDSGAAYQAGPSSAVPAPPAAILLASAIAAGAAGLRRRRKAMN